MISRWIKGLVILPGTILVLVPAAILYLSDGSEWALLKAGGPSLRILIAAVSGLLGLFISGWSMATFFRFGNGTAAPWDPPTKFVACGPYRFVRNPMLTGIFLLLLSEVLLFSSLGLFIWTVIFVTGYLVYIPTVEEPTLSKRFGTDYLEYQARVPRWIPRVKRSA